MDAKNRAITVWLLALSIAIWNQQSSVLGQLGRMRAPQADGVLMSPSREILSLVEEAETQAKAQAWSEATLAIGKLLGIEDSEDAESELGTDYFLNPLAPDNQNLDPNFGRMVRGNLFQRIHKLIDDLPEDAIQILQVRHGLEAKQKLEQSILNGDWKSVESIATRFSFLDVGQDATLLLAERALARGAAIEGAYRFESLTKQPRALKRFGPAVAFASASAYLTQNAQSQAERVLRRVAQLLPKYKGSWNGSDIQWDNGELTSDQLQSLVTKLSEKGVFASGELAVQQPLIAGGNTKRNGNSQSGIPLPLLRWSSELHGRSQTKDELTATLKSQFSLPQELAPATIPSRMPIAVGRTVIASTYEQRIVAVDLKTGLLQWDRAYSGMPLGFTMESLPVRNSLAIESGTPEYLTKRVWGEAAIGNLSSDGERVFALSEIPSVDLGESMALGPAARMGRFTGIKNFNLLKCLSVPQEGAILWEVGGAESKSEPILANTLFLGPPLPNEGELLILGETNGEVYLFSLNPENGKVLWQQPLVVNNGGVVASDSLKRSVGAAPTAEGGLVLCPTLSGNLVCYDMHSRTLLWGLAYRSKPSNSGAQTGLFGGTEMGHYSPFEGRSVDLSPMIAKGVALYAPPDGYGVYAINLFTGDRLWHQLSERASNIRYIGGVFEDTVVVVGQSAIHGLDLKTGKAKWQAITLTDGAQVVGRGVRKDGRYYIPTSLQMILELDIRSGSIVESTKLDQIPGNLINVHDRLISASPTELDCYVIRDVFRKEVKAEIASASVSVASLMNRGELSLAEGDVESAIRFLEEAYRIDPLDHDVWLRLRRASTAALELNFEKYAPTVSQFQIGLENDFAFLRTLVDGLCKQGKFDVAFVRLLDLSNFRVQRRRDQTNGEDFFQATPQLSVQVDRWIESQVRKVLPRLENRSENVAIQKAIQQQKQIIEKLAPHLQRIKLKHLRGISELDPLRVRLANEMIDEMRVHDAEDVLMDVLDSTPVDSFVTKNKDAAVALAKVYFAAGRFDLLASLIKPSNAAEASDFSLEQIAAWHRNWEEKAGYRFNQPTESWNAPATATHQWPVGKVIGKAETTLDGLQPQILNNSILCQMKQVYGSVMREASLSYSSASSLLTMQLPNGAKVWSDHIPSLSSNNGGMINSYAIHGKLFLEKERQIIAVDSFAAKMPNERSERWSRYFEMSNKADEQGRSPRIGINEYWGLPAVNKSFRIVAVGNYGVVVIDEDQLVCLDVHSGDFLWRQSGFQGASIAWNDTQLFCLMPQRKLLTLDAFSGETQQSSNTIAGLNYTLAIRDKFLIASEPKREIQLWDAASGKAILERKLTADAVLGLSVDDGLVALDNAGNVTYWNLQTFESFETKVELNDDKLPAKGNAEITIGKLNLARFDDRLIVMPSIGRYSYFEANTNPISPSTADGTFDAVSGSMFAISVKDGKPLWDETVPVMQYRFPRNQIRTHTPAIILARRVFLQRPARGSAAQMIGLAAVDLKTGKILFEDDQSFGIDSDQFTQSIDPSQSLMTCGFSGVLFKLRWTDEPLETTAERVGFEDLQKFSNAIGKLLREKRMTENNSEQPASPPNDDR